MSGVDLSPEFIIEARHRAENEGATIDYRVGSAEELPFSTGMFDIVRAARVLIYVEDVGRALREMRRVVRPSGRLALIEPDISTTTVNLTDRKLLRLVMDHEANTDVMHAYLPGDLVSALRGPGFTDLQLSTRVVVFPPDLARDYLLQCGRTAGEAGVIDAAAQKRWADEILDRHASSNLFCTVGYFLVTAASCLE